MDLPMNAGCLVVIALYAVHAQVMTVIFRMFRVNEREGYKRTAI